MMNLCIISAGCIDLLVAASVFQVMETNDESFALVGLLGSLREATSIWER